MLRDREVLGQSVRAVDRDSAGYPDQLAGFNVEDFGEFVIKNLVAGLHRGTSGRLEYHIYSSLRRFSTSWKSSFKIFSRQAGRQGRKQKCCGTRLFSVQTLKKPAGDVKLCSKVCRKFVGVGDRYVRAGNHY